MRELFGSQGGFRMLFGSQRGLRLLSGSQRYMSGGSGMRMLFGSQRGLRLLSGSQRYMSGGSGMRMLFGSQRGLRLLSGSQIRGVFDMSNRIPELHSEEDLSIGQKPVIYEAFPAQWQLINRHRRPTRRVGGNAAFGYGLDLI